MEYISAVIYVYTPLLPSSSSILLLLVALFLCSRWICHFFLRYSTQASWSSCLVQRWWSGVGLFGCVVRGYLCESICARVCVGYMWYTWVFVVYRWRLMRWRWWWKSDEGSAGNIHNNKYLIILQNTTNNNMMYNNMNIAIIYLSFVEIWLANYLDNYSII